MTWARELTYVKSTWSSTKLVLTPHRFFWGGRWPSSCTVILTREKAAWIRLLIHISLLCCTLQPPDLFSTLHLVLKKKTFLKRTLRIWIWGQIMLLQHLMPQFIQNSEYTTGHIKISVCLNQCSSLQLCRAVLICTSWRVISLPQISSSFLQKL